jgi:putative FmdB family regulatory protein
MDMPIYEYVCADCGARFGVLRRMSEADQAIACQCCDGTHTSRALSKFAAISRGASGDTHSVGGNGGCSSCGSHHCGSCHHH